MYWRKEKMTPSERATAFRFLAVGLGGSIGAAARVGIGLGVHGGNPFPYATLLCNLAGCLFLGMLTFYMDTRKSVSPWLREGIGVGVIGSFTTFSTFSWESLQLWLHRLYPLAAVYLFASLAGGWLFAWGGYRLASAMRRKFFPEGGNS